VSTVCCFSYISYPAAPPSCSAGYSRAALNEWSTIPYIALVVVQMIPQKANATFLGHDRAILPIASGGLFLFDVAFPNSEMYCPSIIIRKYGFVIENVISFEVYIGQNLTHPTVSTLLFFL